MRTINKTVIQPNTPNDNRVLWLNKNNASYYNNGTWVNIGESSEDRKELEEKVDSLDGNIQIVEKEIQNINSRHNSLNTKHESLSRTVQGIAATGGASTATNVTYNNDASGLNAENAQDAIDELQSSKIDKTSILQESGRSEDKVMSQKAVSNKLSNLSYKYGIIGEDIRPDEITTYKNENEFLFTINISRYIFVDSKNINVSKSYSKEIPLNKTGLYRLYLKSDLTDILLFDYAKENQIFESIFLGTFTLNSNGSISAPYFFGRVKINGILYNGFQPLDDSRFFKILNKKYDTGYLGLYKRPATISIITEETSHFILLTLNDYLYTNRSIEYVNKSLKYELTSHEAQLLFIKRLDLTLHLLDYSQTLTISDDTLDYIFIGMLTVSEDFSSLTYLNLFGKCYYNNDLYFNGIKISQMDGSDDTAVMSQKVVTDRLTYIDRTIALSGLHTDPIILDVIKEDEKYYVTVNIPNYIYAITNNINVNKSFKAELTKNGLYSLFLNKDGNSLIALAHNEDINESIKNGYNIFLGVFSIDDRESLLLKNIQLFGRWKYKGKQYSTAFPEEVSTRLSALEDIVKAETSAEDMYMYVYNKMYLIKDEDYEFFKDSFYYNKKNGFGEKSSNVVVTTDTDVFSGNNISVRFNTRGTTSYATDNNEKNKLSIFINSIFTTNTIGYGVKCDLIVTDNIAGKSIKHTAIGDSQTDNGLIRALGEYLKNKNFTYNGVGITEDGSYYNEGRSGWRYENIVGRSNSQGWRAIEVIYPEGDIKSTDKLHKNPFIRLATDDDKRLYPTKCYTFTAASQSMANYLEKSYQDIVDEGGNTRQNFYIFDIANYYRVQHDWNGEGNPVDAITFAFSTNEFIIEGYTDDTINRLIENVQWVIQRCKEQLPNVKIGFIACPAWSYVYGDKYKIVLKWFKRLTECVDNIHTYIIQPHLFMSRAIYSYNRSISSSNVNKSMIQKLESADGTHYDSIGNYQYAKCLAGWLVSLVK